MARVAQPRHDREQPIEGRLSVRHSHGCRWDREQDFARRYGDCDAIECSTLARTSGQVDRREIRRKFVRLSGGGRRIRTIGPGREKDSRGEGDPAPSLQWRGFSICGRPPPRKVIFSDLISSLADESGRIARKRMYLRRVVDREGEILDISAHTTA